MKAMWSVFACGLLCIGGTAVAEDSASAAYAVICSNNSKETTPIIGRELGDSRVLSRDSHDGTQRSEDIILSTQPNSILWQTKCPVLLTKNYTLAGADAVACRYNEFFGTNSTLTITHLVGGRYSFVVQNLLSTKNRVLVGIAEARWPKDNSGGTHTHWLASTHSNHAGYEFYIYLEENRTNDYPGHKAYRIEAFAPDQCNDHKPDNSICPKTGCEAPLLPIVPLLILQTDTGGGNEPPGIP